MIAFFGTPEFAAVHLEGLLDAGLPVRLVVTRPERPRRRGHAPEPSAVAALAARRGIETLAPERPRDAAFAAAMRASGASLFLVVAYGAILTRELLAVPRLGAVNLHASLLPRWRGAAPIPWAIAAGDATTGVTTFFIDEGLDTGPLILSRETEIGCEETAGELTARLARLGSGLLVETARLVLEGRAPRRPQPADGVTLAPRLAKEHGWVRWETSAEEIARFVRAMTPWPGARTTFRGDAATILRARPAGGEPPAPAPDASPGRIVTIGRGELVVATGTGLLRIESIRMPGRRAISGAEFARGSRAAAGEAFVSPAPGGPP
jgi:methionyl-tRNA formyltransferase